MTITPLAGIVTRARIILIGGAVLAAMLNAAPALAASWAENEGGRMRLVALPPQADGTVRGALQIEPKPGWITYWREPGGAGIPPQLQFLAPGGAMLKYLAYPVPKRFSRGGGDDLGYDHAVTLPFEVKLSDSRPGPLTVSGLAFIGLCRNICIPFQAEFPLALGEASAHGFETAAILNAAQAVLPEKPSADFAVTTHAISADRARLSLELKLPDDAGRIAPEVIVTGPEGHVMLDALTAGWAGSRYRLQMPVGRLPRGYDIRGKSWQVLVIAGKRAMETKIGFE